MENINVSVSEEQHAQLDWAFSIINKMMMDNDLLVIRSKSLNLVVTYLGDV